MTDPAVSVPRMASITARYQNKTETFSHPGGTDAVVVLKFDPQRYFVRFETPPGPSNSVYVFTAPATFSGGPGVASNLPLERKWHDDPAGTTAEWLAIAAAPTTIVVITTRYLGD